MATVPDASALVVGVTPGQRVPSAQPEAVVPQEVRRPPRPTKKTAPTRILQPGDLIRGDCGEGNPPNRRFCSRCGASLLTAEKAHIPWWKRIFRRKPKTLEAGERPWKDGKVSGKQKRKRSGMAKIITPLRRIIAALALIGSLAYGMYSPFRNWVNGKVTTVKDKVNTIIHPQFDPVNPIPGALSISAGFCSIRAPMGWRFSARPARPTRCRGPSAWNCSTG